ncbi:oligosaccharide repeat unit polymerase [Aliifodinibius sp. S!AR15-10]|uniref:O-antigen polymerase n=1 Tax=Aliifodinibius sp. S!AR15-10 TaxID=2950437 RepID=UPI0028607256|nr:O-antigen polymerase [Aliifodinibius sp. S!AR15-10]MDR8393489.1 oligosaccharide repeat unit polymerase [Aliifodinibius sp. S!AR15-10]
MSIVHHKIRFLSPVSTLLLGNLFFIVIFLISPTKVYYPPSIGAILFYIFANIIFSIFLAFSFRFKLTYRKSITLIFDSQKVEKYLKTALIIVCIGIIFRLLDRFYVRGLDLFMSSFERKQLIQSTDSSLFSVISAFIYPAGLFLYPLVRLFKIKSFWIWLFSILVFVYPSVDVLLTGNRGVMVVSTALYATYLISFRDFDKKKMKLLLFLLVGFAAFLLSLYIFIERISSYGFSTYYTANHSVYAYTIKPSDTVNQILKETGLWSTLTFAYTNFTQYYSHGFFEWAYLYDQFQEYSHTMGLYTFYLGGKFVGFITRQSIVLDPSNIQPRSGVYTTFLGPLFVDFGFFIFWILATFGVIINGIRRFLTNGEVWLFPIFNYFLVVLFFFPVVNLIQNALGLYIIASFIVLYLFLRFTLNNYVQCIVGKKINLIVEFSENFK